MRTSLDLADSSIQGIYREIHRIGHESALYTVSHYPSPMGPLPSSDGHDLPRLVDELVPGIAAVIEDILVGLEDPV